MSLEEMKVYMGRLKEAKGLHVDVGVTSDSGYTYPNGSTIQEVAAKHEFGIGVPQRSFIRTPVLENEKQINTLIKKQFRKVSTGLDPKDALGVVGAFVEGLMIDSFRSNNWPDISQATKNAKGSNAVLIDTGVLKGSISSVVRG